MKKIIIIISTIVVFVVYITVIQIKQYNYKKSNIYLVISNNIIGVDSIDYKIYLDGELLLEGIKGHHPHPYYDEIGIKAKLGKHKMVVEADNGKIINEFHFNVFFVRYLRLTFSNVDLIYDKSNKNENKFEILFYIESLFLPYRLVA